MSLCEVKCLLTTFSSDLQLHFMDGEEDDGHAVSYMKRRDACVQIVSDKLKGREGK